jgi:hypothetical protein
MSEQPNSKRVKVDESGIDLLLNAANVMTPKEAEKKLDQLREEARNYHKSRSRLYWFMFDKTTITILQTFSDGKIDVDLINLMKQNIMKEINILNNLLIDIEAEIETLKGFFKNE